MESFKELNKEELEKAKKLSYENMEKEETEVGFVYKDAWITNPFLDSTGRLEFADLNGMYEYYGKENVDSFISVILKVNS